MIVRYPRSNTKERRYIMEEILENRLGLSPSWIEENRDDTLISLGEKSISIHDGFLATPAEDWLTKESIPKEPSWNQTLQLPSLPSLDISTNQDKRWSTLTDQIVIPFDLFGSAFFFLSRYEELASPKQDKFGRYPANESFAVRFGLISRPIVDEYVDFLACRLGSLWSSFCKPQRNFRMEVSHDVDLPLRYRWAGIGRLAGGALLELTKSKSFKRVKSRWSDWYSVRINEDLHRDPYNTFDAIMTESESRGLRSAFYFIADRPAGNRDCLYAIDDPFIEQQIKAIANRGHEIGLHMSFDSYNDSKQTQLEWNKLRSACERLGVKQDVWGGRQHYLRWINPTTYRNCEAIGLDYDSTVGFAQVAGFRCGTCHEFKPFDLLERRTLKLIERPLVVMDATIMHYMHFGTSSQGLEYCIDLKRECQKHHGIFTLLWHNSNLTTQSQWDLYRGILDN